MRGLARGFVAAGVAIVALTGFAATASASFPGVNGKIAWASERVPGQIDIWTANADGSNPVNLSTDTAQLERTPSFSRDGRQLVYEREGALMVMNADGSGKREISTGSIDFGIFSGPAFAADGSRIVFEGKEGGDDNVYSVNVEGPADVENLTPGVPQQDLGPAVSADGNRLAFVSFRSGNGEIWVANANGTSPQNRSARPGFDQYPDISPDSTSLIWASQNPSAYDLFQAPLAGGVPAAITPTVNAGESQPVYSPDGTKRAFVSTGFGGDQDVVVANGAGQEMVNVSEPGIGSTATDTSPTWAVAVDTPRTLTLARKGRKRLKGAVASAEPGCIANAPVSLFRMRRGKDKRLGTTSTDTVGAFKLKRRKPLEGKTYATIAREERSGVAICLGATSPRVKAGK